MFRRKPYLGLAPDWAWGPSLDEEDYRDLLTLQAGPPLEDVARGDILGAFNQRFIYADRPWLRRQAQLRYDEAYRRASRKRLPKGRRVLAEIGLALRRIFG